MLKTPRRCDNAGSAVNLVSSLDTQISLYNNSHLYYNMTMNKHTIQNEIISAYAANDLQKIQDAYIKLINMKGKMDRWFNKFLDMYSEKMDEVGRTHPIMRCYNAKFQEYSDINTVIRTAEHYMKAPSV